MKILLIGDVFGKPGRNAVAQVLPRLKGEEGIDFVIANGENMAGGKGMTPETCEHLFSSGVDVITSGNHVRDKKEIDPVLATNPRVLRPLNYPDSVPGKGYVVVRSRSGVDVGVINPIGRVHMGEILSPFVPTRACVDEMGKTTRVIVVDFHAEATSEKRAMGWYLDGFVSAIVGTHTHVQTADEQILPNGTAYLTDAGMTGPHESVIGLRSDLALERFLLGTKNRFDVGRGDVRFCAAMVDVDEKTGRAVSIRRIQERVP